MARLPESPRRLNVHWSENHLKTWKPDHLINFWAAETVQLNIAEKTTEATPILSPALIICNHIQISTQPDSAAIVIVKEVVTIVIMTTLYVQFCLNTDRGVISRSDHMINCQPISQVVTKARAGVWKSAVCWHSLNPQTGQIHPFQSVTIRTAGMHN